MTTLNRLYSPPELGAPGKRDARRRHRELSLAGLFVLAMVAVVIGILLLMAPGLLSGYTLRAYFPQADGLDTGLDVMMDGYVVGRMRTLAPVFLQDPDRSECPQPTDPRAPMMPCFRATLSIQQAWPVPADSQLQLAPAGVLRGNMLRIVPGLSASQLEQDAVIPTIAREPDLSMQVQATLSMAEHTLDEVIRPTLTRIQTRIQDLLAMFQGGSEEESAIGELGTEVSSGLSAVVKNLTQLSSDIEQSIDPAQIRAILEKVEVMSNSLAILSESLPARTRAIQETVDRYGLLADQISTTVETTRPDLQGSMTDARYLLQELAAAIAPILSNLENASRNLSGLSRELREDPVSLLRGQEQQEQSPWFKQ
jgi:phospholipid/cholesterol/gamma-HCH transport system substrate-binding protein